MCKAEFVFLNNANLLFLSVKTRLQVQTKVLANDNSDADIRVLKKKNQIISYKSPWDAMYDLRAYHVA